MRLSQGAAIPNSDNALRIELSGGSKHILLRTMTASLLAFIATYDRNAAGSELGKETWE